MSRRYNGSRERQPAAAGRRVRAPLHLLVPRPPAPLHGAASAPLEPTNPPNPPDPLAEPADGGAESSDGGAAVAGGAFARAHGGDVVAAVGQSAAE